MSKWLGRSVDWGVSLLRSVLIGDMNGRNAHLAMCLFGFDLFCSTLNVQTHRKSMVDIPLPQHLSPHHSKCRICQDMFEVCWYDEDFHPKHQSGHILVIKQLEQQPKFGNYILFAKNYCQFSAQPIIIKLSLCYWQILLTKLQLIISFWETNTKWQTVWI